MAGTYPGAEYSSVGYSNRVFEAVCAPNRPKLRALVEKAAIRPCKWLRSWQAKKTTPTGPGAA